MKFETVPSLEEARAKDIKKAIENIKRNIVTHAKLGTVPHTLEGIEDFLEIRWSEGLLGILQDKGYVLEEQEGSDPKMYLVVKNK
jgi:hypothetical protein